MYMNYFVLLSHPLLILLLGVVTGECGDSSFLVDPCNEGKQVTETLCVQARSNVTIICNLEDTAAAWASSLFESSALVSSSDPTEKRLNNTVHLQFLNQTSNCILTSVTFISVQQSVNGVDIMCLANVPGRSGADITLFVVDSIASIERIEFNLATKGGYVDLTLINEQKCQFHQFLISSGSCDQLDYDVIIVDASKMTSIQEKVKVPSFSSTSITACTEEDRCLCQTLDFDDFSVTSQEILEGTSYSVTLSFMHDVVIQSINQFGNENNCNVSNDTSKTVNLFCSELLYGTSYSITVEGMASLSDGEKGHLTFTVTLDFVTEEQSVTDEPVVDEPAISPGGIVGIVIVIVLLAVIAISISVSVLVRRRKQKGGKYLFGGKHLFSGNHLFSGKHLFSGNTSKESHDISLERSMMEKVKEDRRDLDKEARVIEEEERDLEEEERELEEKKQSLKRKKESNEKLTRANSRAKKHLEEKEKMHNKPSGLSEVQDKNK